MKEKIIVIVGPTAVGKTQLSIDLAKSFNGEIINGDSMQVYKGLDIGTAKVTEEEAKGVLHHLIDIKEPTEQYTVSDFKRDAGIKIKEITEKGKVPIIVGGTGLYIESLLFDISHGGEAEPNQDFRSEMEELADKKGKDCLYSLLKEKDVKAAESIHPNNVRRVIRALEVIHETGQPFSSYQSEKTKEPIYDALVICLTTNRSVLYDRINERVDIMMNSGLLKEAESLLEKVPKDAQSLKGIGYKEFVHYFDGEESLEAVVETVKQHSRNYAKRQLTWFRNRFEVDMWADLISDPTEVDKVKMNVKDHIGCD